MSGPTKKGARPPAVPSTEAHADDATKITPAAKDDKVAKFIEELRRHAAPELVDDANAEDEHAKYGPLLSEWVKKRMTLLHLFKFQGKGIGPDRNVEPGSMPGMGAASVYYPINPLQKPASLKASEHHVIEVRKLGVDLDVEKGPPEWERQLEGRKAIVRVIEAYEERHGMPTEVVDSGGGFQLLFHLTEPFELPKGGVNEHGDMLDKDGRVTTKPDDCYVSPKRAAAIGEVKARNLGLFQRFDDIIRELNVRQLVKVDHTQNVDRIFRTPWTPNRPHESKREQGRKPTWARVVFDDPSITYPLESFPHGEPKAKASRSKKQVSVNISGNVPRITTDTLESEMFAKVSGRAKAVIVHGEDPDQPLEGDNSRSEWVWYVTCEMVRGGIEDDVIYAILTDPELGISEHILAQGNPDKYARRQIQRVKDEVESTGDRSPVEDAFASRLDQLGVTLEYDQFSDQMKIEGLNGFGPIFDDAAMNRLRFAFSKLSDNKVSGKGMFADLCENHSRYNSRHPVREYLNDVQDKWDRVARVDTWLVDYFGAPDTPFNRAVGRIFLVAAVRRVRQPGCKYDELLVLEGDQGHGKSTILKRLAVNDSWFSDDLPLNADGKRMIEQTGGKWIIECGELKGMRRSDIEALKSTLSRTHDRARLAYASIPSDVPRGWIGAGTTNNRKYLKDQTGNRRFWPVDTGTIDLKGFTADVVGQIWAEAATLEADGESIRLDPALYDAAAGVQRERTASDPVAEQLESVLEGLDEDDYVTADDLWAALGARDVNKRSQTMNDVFGETMQRLQFKRHHRRVGRRRRYCYGRGERSRLRTASFSPLGDFWPTFRRIGMQFPARHALHLSIIDPIGVTLHAKERQQLNNDRRSRIMEGPDDVAGCVE